ncbi:MAG: M48 family metallopeptidase [Clostridiales bacterium]|nr:M48 family metallopeptidase [Clostridiales bacterium]
MVIENIEITVIKSARKTVAIQIKPDGRIYVRAPFDMTDSEVRDFVSEKTDWINKTLRKFEDLEKKGGEIIPLTQQQINELKQKAFVYIEPKLKKYAALLRVEPAKLTVRNQKTCWGSCSKNGNISINCLVMFMPEEVIEYIIVHELCHLKEMNHSKNFWLEVGRILPRYKNSRKWLKENGSQIMKLNFSGKINNKIL